MPASKIVNESEVVRWIEQGRTYDWMSKEYLRRYNVEMTPSSFGNFRRRRGLPRRITRDDQLIPWMVREEHRHDYPILMLRKEARRRAGHTLTPEDDRAVDVWIEGMRENGTVVHYEPDTEDGWFYVPRRKGIDLDLIRVPEKATGRRASEYGE